jgi:hypothetical protein
MEALSLYCYHWIIFEMIFAQPELDKVLFD